MVVLTAGFILQSITIKKHISLMQKVDFRGFSGISATYYSYVSVCMRVLLVRYKKRVTYTEYIQVTYGQYTGDIPIHTDNIRVTYGQHRVTYGYTRTTYGQIRKTYG